MPDDAETVQREAEAHHAAGRFEDALAGYRAALALNPTSLALRFNAASALKHLKRYREAIAAYDEVLAISPAMALAHFNKANCLLQLGELPEGFREYEWRKGCPGFIDDPRYALPRQWAGEPLTGKRLYIYPELFQGDLLQFGRYAILATRIAGSVLLGAPRPMHAILRTMSPAIELVDAAADPPDYDYCCAMMTAPALAATSLETVPRAPRYLHADPQRVSRWRARIGKDGFKIGIAWQGSANAMHRSFPLKAAVKALGGLQGVRLISLQKHMGLEQLADLAPGAIETLGDDFDPGPDAFVDTAAAMMCCDLFVTPDTSVVHLAGGLGVRTWLANAFDGDWRWLEDREDSPWYPSVRIFRQAEPGDWPSAFAAMARALPELVAAEQVGDGTAGL